MARKIYKPEEIVNLMHGPDQPQQKRRSTGDS